MKLEELSDRALATIAEVHEDLLAAVDKSPSYQDELTWDILMFFEPSFEPDQKIVDELKAYFATLYGRPVHAAEVW